MVIGVLIIYTFVWILCVDYTSIFNFLAMILNCISIVRLQFWTFGAGGVVITPWSTLVQNDRICQGPIY